METFTRRGIRGSVISVQATESWRSFTTNRDGLDGESRRTLTYQCWSPPSPKTAWKASHTHLRQQVNISMAFFDIACVPKIAFGKIWYHFIMPFQLQLCTSKNGIHRRPNHRRISTFVIKVIVEQSFYKIHSNIFTVARWMVTVNLIKQLPTGKLFETTSSQRSSLY